MQCRVYIPAMAHFTIASPRFFRNRVVRCGWVTTRRSDGARKSIAVFRRQVVPISTAMEVRQ